MTNNKKVPGAGIQILAALICVVIFIGLIAGCLIQSAQTMATSEFLGRIIDEVGLYDIALLFAGEDKMPGYIYDAVKPEKRADMIITDESLGAVVNSDATAEILKTKIPQWFDVIREGNGALITKEEVHPLIQAIEPVLAEHMNCILLEEDYADIDAHLETMNWENFRWENLMKNQVILKLLSILFNTNTVRILWLTVGGLAAAVCLLMIRGIGIALTHLGVTGLVSAVVLGLAVFALNTVITPFSSAGGEIIWWILNELAGLVNQTTIIYAGTGAVLLIAGIIVRCAAGRKKQNTADSEAI